MYISIRAQHQTLNGISLQLRKVNKFLFIAFLLFSTTLHAQLTTHGVVVAKSNKGVKTLVPCDSDATKVLTNNGSGSDPSWQPVSGGGGGANFPPFPNDPSLFLRGDSIWAVSDYTNNNNNFMDGSGNNTLSGSKNTSGGIEALLNVTSGQKNSAFGYRSLNQVNSGYQNVGIGWFSLVNLTTGSENIAIGVALGNATNATGNVALGDDALGGLVGGTSNVAIGLGALQGLNDGDNNVAIGFHAGRWNNTVTTYQSCVFLGAGSGRNLFSNANGFFISGCPDFPINDICFGGGWRMDSTDYNGLNYAIHGTGAGLNSTDKNGGSITIAGGISTGAGHGGSIIFSSSPHSTTGTSDNALETLLTINDSGVVTFNKNHGSPNQVLTTDGTGKASWQYVLGGYIQIDTSVPVVRYPSVTAGTKGFAFGDSASVIKNEGIAIGARALDSGLDGIAIGGTENSNIHTPGAIAGAEGAISIGSSSAATSALSIALGWSALDENTYQLNNGTGGGNIVIGANAATLSTANFSIVMGYAATVVKNNSIAIGQNAQAQDSDNIAIGHGSGFRNTKHFQINIQSTEGNASLSAFDSTLQDGVGITTARNTFENLWGQNNTTATGMLAVFANGGRDGNPSTFDCLEIAKNGQVVAGRNFQATLRTITNSSDTGIQGEICYDANFIYICTATNTWKRVGISTW